MCNKFIRVVVMMMKETPPIPSSPLLLPHGELSSDGYLFRGDSGAGKMGLLILK